MTTPLLGSAGLESWLRIIGEKAGPQYEAMMRAAIIGARNDGLEEAARVVDCTCVPPEGVVGEWHHMACTVRAAEKIRALKLTIGKTPCCERDTNGDGDCHIHPKVSR